MTNDYYMGNTGPWEIVIGVEVHAQVVSKAKLFSSAATNFGANPNTQVNYVDAAMPGMLPILNRFCVEQAIRTGLGLEAKINLTSMFDRKNYFYADLPAGYQISQLYHPIVTGGRLQIEKVDGTKKDIGITRLHLEQDAGKSFHDQHPTKTYIDLNRAGVALMEIVSEPDLRSAEEVVAYLKKLRAVLRYLGTCDGNMEEGSLRADVNVSVRRPEGPLGTRAEIKNVNSIRFISQAIHYEVARQVEIIENGEKVKQETRLFDAGKGETRSMRSKEEAHDYRYFPDPDLPPLILQQSDVERIRATLPELPTAKKERFIKELGLPSYDAEVIVMEKETSNFYETALNSLKTWQESSTLETRQASAKQLANWLIGDFFAALNRSNGSISQAPVSPQQLAALVNLMETNVISGRTAKEVFTEMWESGKDPLHIVESKGLQQITDLSALEGVIATIMRENADKVTEYRSGKDKLFGFFVGLVMKATGGKANPEAVNALLKKSLS